jgi:hypothetical protein
VIPDNRDDCAMRKPPVLKSWTAKRPQRARCRFHRSADAGDA